MNNSVMMSLDVDTQEFSTALHKLSKDAFPKVVAETLNRTADAVTNEMIKNIKKDFILRSKFTLNSTKSAKARPFDALNKAGGGDITKMFSRIGTISKYLWKQEDGGTFGSTMGGPVPIATLNSRMSGSIRRAVSKKFRLSPGQLSNGPYGNMGDAFIGEPKGLSSKGKVRGRGLYARKGKYLIMLRDLGSDKIQLKPKKFMDKAVGKYGTPQFINAQFIKTAKKHLPTGVN